MKSKYVHLFMAPLHFPHESEADIYKVFHPTKGFHIRIRVSHNYTFSSILMGAQVFPIPSCPMSPNIAKKHFQLPTSDICQLPYFAKIWFFEQYLKIK